MRGMSKAFLAAWRARLEGLRAGISGGVSQSGYEPTDLAQDHLVPLAYERGENVLADRVAPEVIGAVAAWEGGSVQVHPVGLGASGEVIAAVANLFSVQPEAAFQTGAIYTTGGVEVDGGVRSRLSCFSHVVTLSNRV